MASDKFKVLFGGSPEEEVLIGVLEKGSAVIKGTPVKGKFRKGNCIFPNKTQAWGRRLLSIKNGKPSEPYAPDSRIDASHKDYAGIIEWLEWGHKDGYMIEARYEPTTASLDYQYQVTRLGLPTLANDLEHNYLEFPSGYSEFYVDSQGTLIQFFKIHHNNDSSIYKNPNSEYPLGMFSEVKEFNTIEFAAKNIDAAYDAVTIVKGANSFEKLKVIKTVLSRVAEVTYNVAEENSLYESLILYANNQAKNFLMAVDQYKSEVSRMIELGKAYNAFDTTLNGTIVVTLPKKEILIEGVEAKGDDMLQWLYDNCMEPLVFEALERLKLYSQKFKQ